MCSTATHCGAGIAIAEIFLRFCFSSNYKRLRNEFRWLFWVIGACGGSLPDLDVIPAYIMGYDIYTFHHYYTHSLFALFIVALLLLLIFLLFRWLIIRQAHKYNDLEYMTEELNPNTNNNNNDNNIDNNSYNNNANNEFSPKKQKSSLRIFSPARQESDFNISFDGSFDIDPNTNMVQLHSVRFDGKNDILSIDYKKSFQFHLLWYLILSFYFGYILHLIFDALDNNISIFSPFDFEKMITIYGYSDSHNEEMIPYKHPKCIGLIAGYTDMPCLYVNSSNEMIEVCGWLSYYFNDDSGKYDNFDLFTIWVNNGWGIHYPIFDDEFLTYYEMPMLFSGLIVEFILAFMVIKLFYNYFRYKRIIIALCDKRNDTIIAVPTDIHLMINEKDSKAFLES